MEHRSSKEDKQLAHNGVPLQCDNFKPRQTEGLLAGSGSLTPPLPKAPLDSDFKVRGLIPPPAVKAHEDGNIEVAARGTPTKPRERSPSPGVEAERREKKIVFKSDT